MVGGTNHKIYTRRRGDQEKREVVLFNTWGYEVEGERDEDSGGEGESTVNCFEDWIFRDVVEEKGGEELRLKVPLLGDLKRRGNVNRFVELKVKSEMVLEDDSPRSYDIIGEI